MHIPPWGLGQGSEVLLLLWNPSTAVKLPWNCLFSSRLRWYTYPCCVLPHCFLLLWHSLLSHFYAKFKHSTVARLWAEGPWVWCAECETVFAHVHLSLTVCCLLFYIWITRLLGQRQPFCALLVTVGPPLGLDVMMMIKSTVTLNSVDTEKNKKKNGAKA